MSRERIPLNGKNAGQVALDEDPGRKIGAGLEQVGEQDEDQEREHEGNEDEALTKAKLWQQVGFHKPLGGWWYGVIFLIINMFTGVFITSTVISVFYQYPSSGAYVSTVNTLFTLLFFTFDIGTAGVMGRFIPESRINDPVRMIYYIRWFIWYQMITGLIQVTIISIYCFFFATATDLVYLSWIMLLISTRQYPGMLGVFKNLLDTFQYYGRSKIVDFTQGEIVQRLTELLFVWMGLEFGNANPAVGPLMGIALGQSIGTYADDFVGMAIGAYYFRDVARREGFSVLDCFIPRVPWKVIKPVLSFSIKTSIPGLTGNAVSLFVFTLYLTNVSQWVIYGAFVGMAGGITSDIGYARLNVGPLYNESYMNGKKILAQTILMKTYRFTAQILSFYFSIFVVVTLILPDAFVGFNLKNYFPSLVFIMPVLFRGVVDIILGQSGSILYACNKPNLLLLYAYTGQVTDVIYHLALVVWFRVQDMPGGLFFLLVFAGSAKGWLFAITQHIYIHFKLFKIRVSWWQTVVVPLLSCIAFMGVSFPTFYLVYVPLRDAHGFFAGIIPFMIIMILVAILGFFPVTALLGGWDDGSLAEFDKVVKISGPSKWIVGPMFKIVKLACRLSPLHGRFPLDDEPALRESIELDRMRELNKAKLASI